MMYVVITMIEAYKQTYISKDSLYNSKFQKMRVNYPH